MCCAARRRCLSSGSGGSSGLHRTRALSYWGGLSTRSLAALTTVTTPEEGFTLGGRYADPGGQGGMWMSWQSGSNGAYKSLVTYDPASDTGFAAMTAADDTATLDSACEAWLEAR